MSLETRQNCRPSRNAVSATRALVLTVVAASTACYRYVPNQRPDLHVGEEVRVRLTSDGSVALRPVVGADVVAIDGRVTARSDTAYAMTIGATTKRAGGSVVWTGEAVSVPLNAIAGVDRRVLNKRKTFVVSALAVAGGALAAVAISAVSGGGSTGSDTGTTPP